jgi:hypothetical protein
MSSASAIPDSNPTRAQLRLVVLAQWVRAGLDLAWRATARGGLVGGAVALWRIYQAVRLAIVLAQRLSELQGALTPAALVTPSDETPAEGVVPCAEDVSAAAWLSHALIELNETLRDALGLAPVRRARPDTDGAADGAAQPEVPHPLGRQTPPRERPPDRPPKPARRRRPRAARACQTALPPIAAPATGRFRLGAG